MRSLAYVQGNLDALGEVLLQDNFMAWDPKQLIKKGRERHLFMFEVGLLVAKEVKDNAGKSKYMYKMKLMVGCESCCPASFVNCVILTHVGIFFIRKLGSCNELLSCFLTIY